MNYRRQIDFDYYGHSDEDPTARYHNTQSSCMEEPVGDLYDDDNYWLTEDETYNEEE